MHFGRDNYLIYLNLNFRKESWPKSIDPEVDIPPRETFVGKKDFQSVSKRSTSTEYTRRDNTGVFEDARGNTRRGDPSPVVAPRRGNPPTDPVRSKDMSRYKKHIYLI